MYSFITMKARHHQIMPITYAQFNRYKTNSYSKKQSFYEKNYNTCKVLFRSFRPLWTNDDNLDDEHIIYDPMTYSKQYKLSLVNVRCIDESYILDEVYSFINSNVSKKPAREFLKKNFLDQYFNRVDIPILKEEEKIKAIALPYIGFDNNGFVITDIVIDTTLKSQNIPIFFIESMMHCTDYKYVVFIESLKYFVSDINRRLLSLRNLGVYKDQIYSYLVRNKTDNIEDYQITPKLNGMPVQKTPAVILGNFINRPLEKEGLFHDRF